MAQLSFAALDHRNKKKQTKRERFLGEMDAVVPWATLLGLIEPHDSKAGRRNPEFRRLEVNEAGAHQASLPGGPSSCACCSRGRRRSALGGLDH